MRNGKGQMANRLNPQFMSALNPFRRRSLPTHLLVKERLIMIKFKTVIWLAIIAACVSVDGLAQNGGEWPQWRGPNRDGISKETGLLKEWPADGPPLVWKTTGAGGGYSSLAIAGGRLF